MYRNIENIFRILSQLAYEMKNIQLYAWKVLDYKLYFLKQKSIWMINRLPMFE